MKKIKVLIPTDFSIQADFAYQMVQNLQKKIAMEVHFLHVLNVPDTVTMNAAGGIDTCGDIDLAYVNSKKDVAEKNMANLQIENDNAIHTELVLGKTTDKIIEYSTSNNFDLIVMGTKGVWGIREKLVGSNTQIIGKQSKIPVLSLMCDRSEMSIENILVIYDFNSVDKEELKLLHLLIHAYNPKIHLLYIGDSKTDKDWTLEQMDAFAKANDLADCEKHLLMNTDVVNGVTEFNKMAEMVIAYIGKNTRGRKSLQQAINPTATEQLINHLIKPIISFN